MVVKDVKFVNNKVKVICDGTDFLISKENYIENPITIDSQITEEKISKLLEYEFVIENKLQMIKLLNKKALSEYEVYKWLKEKNVSPVYIKQIIDSLKSIGLINDEYVAIITLERELFKRKGKKEIKNVLKEKRIDEAIIARVVNEIDEDLYKENFNKVVSKYLKMYDKKSGKVKNNLLRQKLEEMGYEYELISSLDLGVDNSRELDLAKNSLVKIIKNKNMDLNSYENINKIKLKLANKGFSYDIINMALEEVKKNETY